MWTHDFEDDHHDRICTNIPSLTYGWDSQVDFFKDFKWCWKMAMTTCENQIVLCLWISFFYFSFGAHYILAFFSFFFRVQESCIWPTLNYLKVNDLMGRMVLLIRETMIPIILRAVAYRFLVGSEVCTIYVQCVVNETIK